MRMLLTVAKITALITAGSAGFGCTHAGGKLPVDSPALVYQAPDIDEITGIDSSDTESDEGSAAGSGSGSASAQNPHK